jgi:hypothetical protein
VKPIELHPRRPRPDFDKLLRWLTSAEVRFVLVGGLAVNTWGVVRGTTNVDVVAATDHENLGRLASVAARAVTLRRAPEAAEQAAIAALLERGENVEIATALGPLNVVHGLPGVPPYAELRSRAVEVEAMTAGTVAVCSLEDLRAMKRAAGRASDLADLQDLEIAHAPD